VQFAARFGFSADAQRHRERGARCPYGAALVLVNVIDCNTRAVIQALR
jgi:DNA-binding transcriptional regulator YiaG